MKSYGLHTDGKVAIQESYIVTIRKVCSSLELEYLVIWRRKYRYFTNYWYFTNVAQLLTYIELKKTKKKKTKEDITLSINIHLNLVSYQSIRRVMSLKIKEKSSNIISEKKGNIKKFFYQWLAFNQLIEKKKFIKQDEQKKKGRSFQRIFEILCCFQWCLLNF